MSDGLLTLFKYVFLAILYLFFLRVLRAVWVELREPKVAPVAAHPGGAEPSRPVGSDDATTAVAVRGRRGAPSQLRITAPDDRRGQVFPLGEELTVGRAPGCSVSIPDDSFVSSIHARVFRRDGDVWIEDLGSTNGTLLNDRRVSAPVVMRKGDVLQVGRTTMELTS